jgi:Major Facilitator Superfamily
VLLVAAFGAFLAFLDSTIVNIAFPAIQRYFHRDSISTLSWVLNAYNIVFAAFLVAAGRLADLLGRKRIFIYGVPQVRAAGLARPQVARAAVRQRSDWRLNSALQPPDDPYGASLGPDGNTRRFGFGSGPIATPQKKSLAQHCCRPSMATLCPTL